MHKTQASPTVTVQPLYLNRQDAAAYLSISVSQLEAMSSRGEIPAPRQISSGRAGWLVSELQAWGLARPQSSQGKTQSWWAHHLRVSEAALSRALSCKTWRHINSPTMRDPHQ